MAVFRAFPVKDDAYLSINPTLLGQGGFHLADAAPRCGWESSMSKTAPPSPEFDKQKIVADNRRVRFDYFIEQRFEAGIALQGTEVKALRNGEGSIAESYATVEGEEVVLINSHIPEYKNGSWMNHEPRRKRRLLLKKREIGRLMGAINRQGLTLVPLSIYFNGKGKAKVELALARGKKVHDKRETIKERDWKREQQRLMKSNG